MKESEDYILETLIKKQHFNNLINKVKDINGAILVCKELNIGISDIVFNVTDTKDETAYKQLKIIILALNEGWKPDWTDADQCKYYPYFAMRNGGFSYSCYNDWASLTFAGARLCFKNVELLHYAVKQFIEIYRDYIVI